VIAPSRQSGRTPPAKVVVAWTLVVETSDIPSNGAEYL
jgi:hypothetical protein